MANRTIRTAKNRKRILDSLAQHGRITLAIKAAGISRSAVKAWRDEDPEFNQAIAELVEETDESNTETVEHALLSSALEGNVTAQIFWLKAHRRETYGDKPIDLNHTQNEPFRVIVERVAG